MSVTQALIIASPYIDRILAGLKTWEMRSTATKKRGRIALVRKGSGLIVGTVEIRDSIGPLTQEQMLENTERHHMEPERILSGAADQRKYAWVLRDAHSLTQPVPYDHPSGAVIWVTLDLRTQERLAAASSVRQVQGA